MVNAATVVVAVLATGAPCGFMFSRGHWGSRAAMLPCRELVSQSEAERVVQRSHDMVARLTAISDDVTVEPARANCPADDDTSYSSVSATPRPTNTAKS